jgi:hypothetical protein
MANVLKLLRVALSLTKLLPEQILAFGYGVLKGLTGNPNLSTPPIDLGTFKTDLDTFAETIADAKDGSRKAIALRNQQFESIMRTLRTLASYVEVNCKDDPNIVLSSGFQLRSGVRKPSEPLPQPVIERLDQGISSQLLALVKTVHRAKSYDVRVGAMGPGGTTPASWTTVTIPHSRKAAQLDGLTPGTIYAVQVRAYGSAGHTPWSDSATRMAI